MLTGSPNTSIYPRVSPAMIRFAESLGSSCPSEHNPCFKSGLRNGASNFPSIGKFASMARSSGELPTGTTNVISAYCPDEGVCLAQALVPHRANEISTAPALLDLIDLKGAIVTGDAAYAQRNLAKKIYEAEGNYCLALKENQGALKKGVEALFARNQPSIEQAETEEKNRGRIEKRCIYVSRQVDALAKGEDWSGLSCVIRLDSYRRQLGSEAEVVPEKRYYISSLKASPEELLKCIRGHWSIENQLHRRLDVSFGEDAWVMRKKVAAANLSVMRKIAGTMLSQIDPKKPLRHKQMWVHGSETFRNRMIRMLF